MFNRTDEVKVLRDPIHGYIHIEYQVIWDCLNAREFQRLHRIHQLGGNFQVYHTAEHSRFSHSLGVYEIVRRMVTEIESIDHYLSEREKIQVMCAALLHDIGHGPYSHFFETLSHIHHEKMTTALILDPGTEVHKALVKADKNLPERIVAIIEHRHPKEVLNQMISSQLDADRMDYLLRDAYETGTSYGTFDLERILRTMRVKEDKLCMKESGMHSVEDYIMARYHMYWQVYLHPDAASFELLIRLFFKRYAQIRQTDPIQVFECIFTGLSIPEFILMDENRMIYGFQEALFHRDSLIQDFAGRILDRHLFGWIEDPREYEEQMIKDQLQKAGFDLEYYYYEEYGQSSAYLPYEENQETIWILDRKEELIPISQKSEIVKALLKIKNITSKRIYFAKI